MRRHPFVWMLSSAAALLAIVGSVRAERPEADRPPNILFVFIDDLGYGDLSCFGNDEVLTETMDRLAAEGVRFTQFYVNSPICSPSRVAVTTGQYPARWNVYGHFAARQENRKRGMPDWLDPNAVTLPRLLHEAGYATGHFGKWHMGGGRDVGDAPLPQAYGFDESLVSFEGLGDRILENDGLSDASAKLGRGHIERVEKYEKTRIYVDHALDFIHRHRDEPFYVNLWPNDVHDGHNPAPGEAEKFQDVADNEFEARFFAVLTELDRQLGRLFDGLDAMGLAENTMIVLTGDNGPTAWPRYYRDGAGDDAAPGSTGGLRGRKWSLYEGGLRQPLIVRWPGRARAGVVNETTVVAAIDLLPSLCDIAGVALPEGYKSDGVDQSRELLGEVNTVRARPIFWEYNSLGGNLRPGLEKDQSPTLALRDGDWKLLVNPDGSDLQLYDLADDRAEANDLHERFPAPNG